jgi:hypothetical protein
MGKLKIEINNVQNIKDLLQETYRLADEQITQAQNEINKLANATQLQNEVMDAKGKYGKAMNDFMGIKDKAIAKKLDIAKLLTDIYQHNGDVKGALSDENASVMGSFDIKAIRKTIDEEYNKKEKTKTIELKK